MVEPSVLPGRGRWWRRPLLALTSFVVSLALVEVGLRVAWTPWSARSHRLFEESAVYGWAPCPGITGVHATPEYRHAATHNAQGLRATKVFAAAKPEGARARVLFLGDSFTYGLGAADDATFVARFDALHPDVEVVNAGANGYSTRECVAVLDHLGAALRPDLVVYVFFWNDLDDNLTRDAPSFELDVSGRVVRTDRPRPSSDPLAPRPAAPLETGSPSLYLKELVKEGAKGARYRLFGMKERAVHTPELKAEAWRRTEPLLAAMRARASELGSELVVVCLPDHNQVDPDASIQGIGPLNYDVQGELAAICARLRVAFVDLLPGMRRVFEDASEPLYYFADRHLTPAGNRVVAELLSEALGEQLAGG